MKLPASTGLAKLNFLITCGAFVCYIVSFATNYWLEKTFDFPVNVLDIPTIKVKANIGLFTACKVEYYRNGKSYESCSPEGAANWQIISAGLSIAGLVTGLVGIILSFCQVVLQKAANNFRVKLASVSCDFLTCGFYLGPLMMFPINSKIQVRPNLSPFQVDFDHSWSYTVAGVSTALFGLLVLVNITDVIWSGFCDGRNQAEDQQALSKERNVH